jgi:ComF family protein
VRVTTVIRDLVDFCYPPACAACRAECETGEFLCAACLDQFRALESAAGCERCGMPLAYDGAPCPFCNDRGIRYYRRLLRLGTFSDPLKTLIHQLKYNSRWSLAERLADRLMEQERVRTLLNDTDVIAAVPLHRWKQFRRGYNQADLIAERLSQKMHKPLVRPAIRVRNTESQTHLRSRQERLQNLRNAFRLINPKLIADKRVLVIDDVTTTGATLQSLARTLKRAKPANLSALVVAIADPKHRDFQVV